MNRTLNMTSNQDWYCMYPEGHRCPDEDGQCEECRYWASEDSKYRTEKRLAELKSPYRS
jgi:hypothetical protein